jgi:hypothetical protein
MAVFEIIPFPILIMPALDAGICVLGCAKKMTGSNPVMMRYLMMRGLQEIVGIDINSELD